MGEILRELYLAPLDISVTDAAERLGVTRQGLKNNVASELASPRN